MGLLNQQQQQQQSNSPAQVKNDNYQRMVDLFKYRFTA